MSLDLFEREIGESLSGMGGVQAVEPGAFDGFLRGTGQYAMQGFAKMGRGASLAVAAPVSLADRITGGTELGDWYFKNIHDRVFGEAVDAWTPKPLEVGAAAEIAGNLLSTLPLVIASPHAAVALTGLGSAEDLARQGASPSKAIAVGMAQATGLGLGIWMPILGQNYWQRALVGGAGFNVLQGVGTRAASGLILEGTPQAEAFKAFDGKAMTLDVLLGLAFGSLAHLSPAQRAQGAQVWTRIRDWAVKAKPSEVAAIATLRTAQHLNQDSAPGRLAEPADVEAHANRVRAAVDQLASDTPVSVDDLPAAKAEPDPQRFVQAAQRAEQMRGEGERFAKTNNLLIEEPVIRSEGERVATFAKRAGEEIGGVSHLRGIVEKLQRIYIEHGNDAGRASLDDMARNAPESSGFSQEVATKGFIRELDAELSRRADSFRTEGPAGQPAGAEPPPPRGSGGQPAGLEAPSALEVEARNLVTEQPDLHVVTGQDADGAPLRQSAKDFLAAADARAADVDVEQSLIRAAAACLLGIA